MSASGTPVASTEAGAAGPGAAGPDGSGGDGSGAADSAVLTPRIRRVLRRAAFWIGLALVLLLVAAVAFSSIRAQSSGRLLDPEDAAPTGALALAEVLRQQGVDVQIVHDIDSARDAASSAADPTLLVHDPDAILDDARVRELPSLASRLVYVQPDVLALDALAPALAAAGGISGRAEAGCPVPAAQRAETLRLDGTGYTVLPGLPGAETATPCFEDADGAAALVQLDVEGTRMTVLGAAEALSNEHIDSEGNAALALGLLGESAELIWYEPDFRDLADGAAPTAAELLPRWLTPVTLLAAVVALLAAVWRGRRLGPLVVERMPVVVPASETMEGRARLYARGSARLHALDALRVGTVARLAALCGLGRSATVTEIADAVAAATARPREQVAGLLVDEVPHDDAALVRLSDRLLDLERETAEAVRPAGDRRPPTERMDP